MPASPFSGLRIRGRGLSTGRSSAEGQQLPDPRRGIRRPMRFRHETRRHRAGPATGRRKRSSLYREGQRHPAQAQRHISIAATPAPARRRALHAAAQRPERNASDRPHASVRRPGWPRQSRPPRPATNSRVTSSSESVGGGIEGHCTNLVQIRRRAASGHGRVVPTNGRRRYCLITCNEISSLRKICPATLRLARACVPRAAMRSREAGKKDVWIRQTPPDSAIEERDARGARARPEIQPSGTAGPGWTYRPSVMRWRRPAQYAMDRSAGNHQAPNPACTW